MTDPLAAYFTSLKSMRETPIDSFDFGEKYLKLLKRLVSIQKFDPRLGFAVIGDIMDTPTSRLSHVRSFGKNYCELFTSLQADLLSWSVEFEEKSRGVTSDQLSVKTFGLAKESLMAGATETKAYFNPTCLEDDARKALSKLHRLGVLPSERFYVADIMKIEPHVLAAVQGIGKQTIQTIGAFQRWTYSIFPTPETLRNALLSSDSPILSETSYQWEPLDLELRIIEDFENFAIVQADIDQRVLCSRLGYNTDFKTLEQLGELLNLTRERVRQLEVRQKRRLRNSLRFLASDLETMITESQYPPWNLFSRLRSCFESANTFLSFLDLMCDRKDGFLSRVFTITFSPSVLNDLFCLSQAPVVLEDVVNELQTQLRCSEIQTRFVLEKLISDNIVKRNDTGAISPCVLPVHAAMAQILLGFPNGLPWKEMIRLCNHRRLTKEIQREDRLVPDRFTYTGFVVLSGRGEYKHFKYMVFSPEQKNLVLRELGIFLKKFPGGKTGLQIFYTTNPLIQKGLDYFTCRHIVREYGSEVGIHFNGHSSTDTVSIDVIESLRTQKDELWQYISSSPVPCLQESLVSIIKSRSLAHLNLYISELLNEKKIVRVDEKSYWVPELILSSKEIELVMNRVVQCLMETQTVIEADYFRELLNREMSFSYSRYFYASIIRYYSADYGLVTKRSLFSLNDFPFSSQREVFEIAASRSNSRRELFESISRCFLSTKETYNSLIDRMGGARALEQKSDLDF